MITEYGRNRVQSDDVLKVELQWVDVLIYVLDELVKKNEPN